MLLTNETMFKLTKKKKKKKKDETGGQIISKLGFLINLTCLISGKNALSKKEPYETVFKK